MIVAGALAFAACSGSASSPQAGGTQPSSSTSPTPPPTGPVTIQYMIQGNSALFAGPVNFLGTGTQFLVTLVVSEPHYRGAFVLTLSAGCSVTTVVVPSTTDANGEADIYPAAGAPPFTTQAGCTITATDPYNNTSAPLAFALAAGTAGVDAATRKQ